MNKIFTVLLILIAIAVAPNANASQDWPNCRQPATVNQLFNYFNNAGQGNQSWTQYLQNNVTFVGARFVKAGHRGNGDYSLTTCAADFQVVAPNGQVVVWTQTYVVRHGQLYDINPADAGRFANQLMAMR